jgi:mono/diheme cytochrome c family protein
VSILDGKEPKMPSWREKLSQEQARGLVAYVRAFAPPLPGSNGASPSGFDEPFRRLEEQMHELQRQARKLSEEAPGGAPSQPSVSPQQDVSRPSAPTEVGVSGARELFRKRCVKCHGEDGTGSKSRGHLPEIPDFTQAACQARRADAQLMASVLDGKGSEMPVRRWHGRSTPRAATTEPATPATC